MSLLRQIYCINHKKGDFIMKKFSVLTSRKEAVDFFLVEEFKRYLKEQKKSQRNGVKA